MTPEIPDMYSSYNEICSSPVFIIGSPRSGTTILAWSLAQHSRLWTSEESEFLFDLFGNGQVEKAFQKAIQRPNPSWLRVQGIDWTTFLRAFGVGLNALFTSKSNGRRWIEQTPHYGLMADVLADMFPGALFLHILRDGRNVVHSMINITNKYTAKGIKARRKSGYLPRWPDDFRSACIAWRNCVEACMSFCNKNPSRCLTVVNEQLATDAARGFARIFDFLGLPKEDSVISYFRSNRINSSFPNNTSGGAATRNWPKPWVSWSAEQRSMFLDAAGETMLKYGLATELELNPLVDREYTALVKGVRAIVQSVLPMAATIAVISKGDDELLNLCGRRAWHIPQEEGGNYTGYHPGDSDEAVHHLEVIREKGADYLLLPSTSFWWLEYYGGFRQHLEQHYTPLVSDKDCIIYSLTRKVG